MLMNRTTPFMVPVDDANPAIIKNEALCSECGHCFAVCEEEIGVAAKYLLNQREAYQCIGCGQCSAVCPEKAITGRPHYKIVKELIKDPEKIVVFSTSPSVRVGFADGFGKEPGTFAQDEMVGALRALGAVHPDKTKYLSSAKSPIGMQGAVIKTYFAHKKHIDPEKIISVAVTPCTAKKAEIAREELCDAGKLLNIEEMRDNDYVITTKELVQWCKEEGMDLGKITPSKYDSVLGEGTGAGMIFGNTGGVMEAALRTVYRVLEGKEAPADFYQLRPVRGLNNRKEAEVTIAGKNLRVCILYGTAAAEEFLAEDMSGYHFVEVMTCPGGCISGAGQPDCGSVPVSDAVRKKRIASLYQADERAQYRNSMDNPEIGMIYNEFFKEPLSLLSETLLHTTYKSK